MNARKRAVSLFTVTMLMLCISQLKISHAQNADTRKGWDLRGYGYDSAARFISLYASQLPIIIGVSTLDAQFTKEVKNIIREFDIEGYENIALILYDQVAPTTGSGETHEITFYLRGEPVTSICKVDGKWGIVFINNVTRMDMEGMVLVNCKTQYPITLIKTKFKTLFKEYNH